MHMAWLRHVGGRLESRYRYSIGLFYNTFPFLQQTDLSKLETLAQDVLNARSAYPDSMLDNLYDPDPIPPKLRKMHLALDRVIDRLYKLTGFARSVIELSIYSYKYEKNTGPATCRDQLKKKTKEKPNSENPDDWTHRHYQELNLPDLIRCSIAIRVLEFGTLHQCG